jgi:WD40 repeat protein
MAENTTARFDPDDRFQEAIAAPDQACFEPSTASPAKERIMQRYCFACRPRLLTAPLMAALLLSCPLARGQGALPPKTGEADQEKMVRKLVAALQNKDWYTRHRAAWDLGDMGPAARAAVPALAKALTDPDRWVRNSAALALGKVGTAANEAIPALIAAVTDKQRTVRESVAKTLLDLAPAPAEAVPALSALLKDRDPDVRELGCTCLARVGPAAAKAVSALAVTAASDPVYSVRIAAVTALGELGPAAQEAVPMLGTAMKDKDRELRSAAVKALRNIGAAARRVIPVLLREEPMANCRLVLWSRDSKVVVIGLPKNRPDDFLMFNGVKLWDLVAWKERAFIKDVSPPGVFSSDGRRLALMAAGDPRTRGLLVWDVSAGRKLASLKANPDEPLIPFCFSKDGMKLALLVGRWTNLDSKPGPLEVVLWDLGNNKTTTTKGQQVPGLKIVLTATGPQPFPSKDSKLTLDDILAGKARVKELASTEQPNLTSLLAGTLEPFSPICATSADGRLRAKVPAIWGGFLGPAGLGGLLGAGRGQVTVEEVKTGKEMALKAQSDGIQGIAFSPNGKTLAVYDSDNQITVWDSATGEQVASFLDPLTETPLEWYPFTLILPGNQLFRVHGTGEHFRLELWGLPLTKK